MNRQPTRPGKWRWAVTAAYVMALVVGTHMPDDSTTVTGTVEVIGSNDIAHFLAYAGLAFLVFGFCGLAGSVRRTTVILAGLMLFAGLDELTQPWFGRTADWMDWFIDVLGLVAGTLVGIAWAWYASSRQSSSLQSSVVSRQRRQSLAED